MLYNFEKLYEQLGEEKEEEIEGTLCVYDEADPKFDPERKLGRAVKISKIFKNVTKGVSSIFGVILGFLGLASLNT